jgi:hypothetical protein
LPERKTRAAPWRRTSRAPVSQAGGLVLKALMTGACALLLLVIPATAQSQSDAGLRRQLTHHLSTMKKDRQVVQFFETHGWLLSDPRFAVAAKRQLSGHRVSLALHRERLTRVRAILRTHVAKQKRLRRLASLRAASPAVAICKVFGSRCNEALRVSRCESGLRTSARNGEYLGLFQMGSKARRLFGHGPTAIEQVRAAHRYFVASGLSWRPWSCKP